MTEKQLNVQISIAEDLDTTSARAVLTLTGGTEVVGTGHARRNPMDQPAPEIGDELAVGRALIDLADRLLDVAARDVAMLAGRHH
ncbi:DUF1876 domain-containing protein [Streptosporangium sp. KLBMP 9127]|nr:DUF1876 domain-containing protein [Streptosporangium sp. KLBMP 9127]